MRCEGAEEGGRCVGLDELCVVLALKVENEQ